MCRGAFYFYWRFKACPENLGVQILPSLLAAVLILLQNAVEVHKGCVSFRLEIDLRGSEFFHHSNRISFFVHIIALIEVNDVDRIMTAIVAVDFSALPSMALSCSRRSKHSAG